MPKQPEQIRPISSLQQLQLLSDAFENDRPLLGMRNSPHLDFLPNPDGKGYYTRPVYDRPMTDVTTYKRLLSAEIAEFNGGADSGYFSVPENREDYRQQEVSDMVLFILAYFKGLGEDADHKPLQPNERRVHTLTKTMLHDLQILRVPTTVRPGRVEPFSPIQEEKFAELKSYLNDQHDRLAETPTTNLQVGERLRIKAILENTLAICFVIHHLMRVNPVRQVGEKIARNYLRYPAHMLGIAHVPQLEPNLSLEERREKVEKTYRARAKVIQDLWDGPVDESGHRPGHGTNDFYGGEVTVFDSQTIVY